MTANRTRGSDTPEGDASLGRAFRWMIRGALLVGGIFLLVSVLQTLATGGRVLRHLGPILAMTVIGATVGGLAGPLVGGGIERRRERGRREEADGPPE